MKEVGQNLKSIWKGNRAEPGAREHDLVPVAQDAEKRVEEERVPYLAGVAPVVPQLCLGGDDSYAHLAPVDAHAGLLPVVAEGLARRHCRERVRARER